MGEVRIPVPTSGSAYEHGFCRGIVCILEKKSHDLAKVLIDSHMASTLYVRHANFQACDDQERFTLKGTATLKITMINMKDHNKP